MSCSTLPGTATMSANLPASSVPVSPSMPSSFAEPWLLLSSAADGVRSEEHTSELQSLMRISYAVFCLKKKTKQHTITYTTLLQLLPRKRLLHHTPLKN